ncbi:MAG: U32 family peptidase [Candidatus Izemoplasmatales bacterium]|nr:U32 family peptidase [Candidatus Izemoplasmatales bacterium]
MKKVEILAPAGSRESLIGAINAKADAIYLAGKKFGARAYATNFERVDFKEIIDYAHLRGVLVFVAVNTVIYDEEINELIEYTDSLVEFGVDAFIVQDLGVIDILTKRYPDTDIHASTQTNTLNVNQAKFLKNLGVKRIVMARETPLDLIRQIKKEVDIELEVFIHGALCVSYSGNCLMSSMLHNRSGNRGECAQPCRMAYSLMKEDSVESDEAYLLSTKDLMTLEYMDQLIESGIDSFKIEGRMRKPEYVIQTVLSYRKAVDTFYEKSKINYDEEVLKLKKVFNRGFTKGYILNEKNQDINHDYRPNHMGIEIGEVIDFKHNKATIKLVDSLEVNDGYRILGEFDYGDVVSRILTEDGMVKNALSGDIIKLDVPKKVQKGSKVLKTLDHELEMDLDKYLDEHYKTIPLKGKAYAKANEFMTLSISDGSHEVRVTSKDKLSKAIKQPVKKEQIVNHISKLGNTPFFFESLIVETSDDCFITIKDLNELRRQAIEKLIDLRIEISQKRIIDDYRFQTQDIKSIPSISVKVTNKEQLSRVLELDIERIYYEDIIKGIAPSESLVPVKKRIQLEPYELQSSQLINDFGSTLTHDTNFKLYTDEFLNVTNIYSIRLLHSMNVSCVTLSPELSKEQVFKIIENYRKEFKANPCLELVVYGAVDLMISKYCPIAKTFKTKQNCHLCERNQYYLKNKSGNKFALINDGNCNLRILNYRPLNLIEYAKDILDLGISIRLHFTIETPNEVDETIKAFKNAAIRGANPISLQKYAYGRFI